MSPTGSEGLKRSPASRFCGALSVHATLFLELFLYIE